MKNQRSKAVSIVEQWTDFNGKDRKLVTKMVKVKVIKPFNDKTTGFITRPVNEVFECSDERAEQLIKGGFAEPVPDKPKKIKSVD